VLEAEANLLFGDGQADPVSIWHMDKSEVMRFRPNINARVLLDIWEEKVRDFFRPLREDYERAIANAG
jgi:hypothetical protein